MARPIPKNLLIHSVTHKTVTGTDMYGNETITSATVNRVRLEPTKKTMLSDLGEGKDDRYLMFWDAKNSDDATFSKLDKITFNSIELTIREIFEAYDGIRLHHLEVYLT